MKKYLSLILASSMILQSLSMVQATEVVGEEVLTTVEVPSTQESNGITSLIQETGSL